ncbi:MAG: SLC13 family permease [Spirochaetales bacterium]|nr:SLC13 family permease [Spirochaetales bacterium]MCF7938699.1 SLC13 family permease [Spirochaetales bacterium]
MFSVTFTVIVVLLILAALATDAAGSEVVFFSALGLFLMVGIISPAEALSGFANKGMFTVGLLFIISKAIQNTGALVPVEQLFLNQEKKQRSLSFLLAKLMPPITFLSAFLNNTPIVVLFTPVVRNWAHRNRVNPSKVLIPLSYAAIFGGVCTLIGTSTNLVIHGLMIDNGFKGLGFFELSAVGLPVAGAGFLYMFFVGHKLLPDRKDVIEEVETNRKEYLIGIQLTRSCPYRGRTVKESGLHDIQGLYLYAIERNGRHKNPVALDERLQAGDKLLFAGEDTEPITELTTIPGIVPVDQQSVERDLASMRNQLTEVVVSSSSPIIGKSIADFNTHRHYNSAVMAIHRNGERIDSQMGGVNFKAGDTLVLLTNRHFKPKWRFSQDFYLVSDLDSICPGAKKKAIPSLIILGLMIVGAALGDRLPKIGNAGVQPDMFFFAFAASMILVLIGSISHTKARDAIRWDILITIACAFGISKAIQNSGAAQSIAVGMISILKSLGPIGILATIYLMTTLFTEIITNNAAAALMFPIALSAAQELGANPRAFFIAVAIAASTSFATPIGYQTNLIVQGAGGYKFSDYLKVGLPLNIIFFSIAIVMIPRIWGI